MFALNSYLFSSYGCSLENTASHEHEQNDLSKDNRTNLESFIHFCSSVQPKIKLDQATTGGTIASTFNPNMAKKLNHNAKEQERCKQINSLFSSLRSLLPATHQMKNLTNLATVAVVLKYIPKIQQQVETLLQKKDVLSRISRQAGDLPAKKKQGQNPLPAAISANQLNGSEDFHLSQSSLI